MTVRREFLAQLGALVAASSLDVGALKGMSSAEAAKQAIEQAPKWDLSWLDKINAAKNRVAFSAHKLNDGGVVFDAEIVLDQFHEVYGTGDEATCPVIVLRGEAVAMGLNDSVWTRYPVGEQVKVTDSATHAPSTRNVFWKQEEGASEKVAAQSISELQKRGLICLVCNRALKGWAGELAEKTKQKSETVYADLGANLIPGAYLVPSGIFALIRAQNAGCAYMSAD